VFGSGIGVGAPAYTPPRLPEFASWKISCTMPKNHKINYVPSIDGLRAVAVLMVMAYHLDRHLLPGGFVGVDIFFVISGFVVMLSIYQHRFNSIFELVSYFYARRLTRIAPALIFMLLVVSLASTSFIPSAWLSDTNSKTALYAFFGVSNLLLYDQSENYFDPRTDFNPFVHTWSLGIEEQFYLVFPLMIMLLVLNRFRYRATVSLAIAVFLSVSSLMACAILTPSYPLFSFFRNTNAVLGTWAWGCSSRIERVMDPSPRIDATIRIRIARLVGATPTWLMHHPV
jgi:peptidoglycan/LPS O-acetylase OafA/YrhL